MRLLSPIQDFCDTTLSALGGLLNRLKYFGELRQPGGGYLHWGLGKTYGHEAADEAIHQAHVLHYLECLRTSLRALTQETERASQQAGISEAEYVAGLCGRREKLEIEDQSGGSRRHFNSVLLALQKLAQSPESTHPGASQSPPPAP